MLELIGVFAGVLFSISSIPMTYKVIKVGKVEFLPITTILSVWAGAILMIAYLILKNGFDYIVLLDYAITILGWTTVLFYYIFPRKVK